MRFHGNTPWIMAAINNLLLTNYLLQPNKIIIHGVLLLKRIFAAITLSPLSVLIVCLLKVCLEVLHYGNDQHFIAVGFTIGMYG